LWPSSGNIKKGDDSMAQTGFIGFDPVKIAEAAGKLDRQHAAFTQIITGIRQKSESLRPDWHGDSADAYFDKAARLDQQGTELAQILLALSQNLAQASGVYKEGESQARRAAEALPADGVFRV
jgi:WXG100 family type VII secretion target